MYLCVCDEKSKLLTLAIFCQTRLHTYIYSAPSIIRPWTLVIWTVAMTALLEYFNKCTFYWSNWARICKWMLMGFDYLNTTGAQQVQEIEGLLYTYLYNEWKPAFLQKSNLHSIKIRACNRIFMHALIALLSTEIKLESINLYINRLIYSCRVWKYLFCVCKATIPWVIGTYLQSSRNKAIFHRF